ncbi:NAD-dependent epimerase/dehydratase family protein [Sphingomonas aestuarii]
MTDLANRRILVTGSAGFIGFHVARALLERGAKVLGIDDFTPYYDPRLKEARNAQLENHPGFALARLSIADAQRFGAAWRDFRPQVVIHLAAQAGVRYSIDHPQSYIDANITGTFNLLELARHNPLDHLLAASTSSVYGANTDMPFAETQRTQTPVSLYAATKGATELIGHSYAHLFGIPSTFFRFFTVYGPWGRPDMAPIKFARAILSGEPIDVYNHGDMVRDFTFVDDLAASILDLIDAVPGTQAVPGDSLSPVAPFRTVNIGGGNPVKLGDFIDALERAIGRPAVRNLLPMQPGDMHKTDADIGLLETLTGKRTPTPLDEGIAAFVDWYRGYNAA